MKCYVATVHLLVNADSEAEACGVVAAFMRKAGAHDGDSGLRDWQYVRRSGLEAFHADAIQRADANEYVGPREIDVPLGYDRDESDIEQIIVERKVRR
jgi:hypothetical protein